jgi:hypothetical protein
MSVQESAITEKPAVIAGGGVATADSRPKHRPLEEAEQPHGGDRLLLRLWIWCAALIALIMLFDMVRGAIDR